MKKMILQKKLSDTIFQLIAILLFLSFFDESELSLISFCALVAIACIPIIIIIWFFINPPHFELNDYIIISMFALFMILQGCCADLAYSSITPIYRSFTVLTVVLYIKRFEYCKSNCNLIIAISLITVALGFATIFTPAREGTNLLFGNYNTVGALYFSLTVINYILYLRNRRNIELAVMFCCIALILLSITRTALFLLVILFLCCGLLKILPKSIIKPKYIIPVFFLLIIGFVLFYYNIKSLSIYSTINKIFKTIFNKNFDTGRPDLWHMTIDAVGNKWIFGCGTGIDLEYFYVDKKTPHNVYLDIYLQNGVVGVILFIICIISVLNNKGKWYNNTLSITILSAILVCLFYNSLCMLFTKARSGIGLLQWALIALPYVDFNKKPTNKYSDNLFSDKNV